MATQRIRLVQGDTRPDLVLSLTDERTGMPLDISDPNTKVRIYLREVGADAIKATLTARPIPGRVNPDTEQIDTHMPYDVAGRGGRCVMNWTAQALDTAGQFECEVETTFADGAIQTAYKLLRVQIREQF